MEFSRQDYCSGLPFPPPRDLPDPEIKPSSPPSPALAGGSFTHCTTWADPTCTEFIRSIWKEIFSPRLAVFWHALDLVCGWDQSVTEQWLGQWLVTYSIIFSTPIFFFLVHAFSLFFFFSRYFSLFPWFTYSSYAPSYGCPEAISRGWVVVCVCTYSVVSDFATPWACSPPGSSVHGIFQARMMEWVAISYSEGSSRPRDQTHVSHVSCIGRQILYLWATWTDIQRQWKNPVA